jgi:hypothetical protein
MSTPNLFFTIDLFGNSPIRHSRESGNPDVKDYKPVPLDSCLRRNDGFRTSLLEYDKEKLSGSGKRWMER